MGERTAKLGSEIIRFGKHFKIDADVMECRKCKARYHLSHAHDDMRHRDGCSEADLRPWRTYTGLMAQVLPASDPSQGN